MMLHSLTDRDSKYPVYMDLNFSMTVKRLMKIICELESIGAKIVGISCNQCGGNQGLFSKLGVTKDKPYFTNHFDLLRLIHCFFN